MEVLGKIKKIDETKTFGESGFRKREVVITTDEQYPQMLNIEFVQDKCDILDKYKVGQDVKVHINLRGREWINPEGVAVYFNTIQGWRIELANGETASANVASGTPAAEGQAEPDDLPF